MWEIYSLAILMIAGSLVAVHTRYLLSAVISLAVVGLALCVTFLYLQAPDCAITQIVVEVVALIILIRATGIEKDLSEIKGRREVFALVSVIIFIIVFAAFAFRALTFLPQFGYPVMKVAGEYIGKGLEETGAANLVTSVLLDFRAYDTLGEATILFTSIIGATVVLRKIGRRSR
jgi:multisubunit Na+/H+ antiporter MnhB subunit